MTKIKVLYHGSNRLFKGDRLLPKEAKDLANRPENIHRAVYSTNIKNIAIAMAIISCKGVKIASLGFEKKPFGTIYKGWPKQDYVYLYTIPSTSFNKSGVSRSQYISFDPVKPYKVEKLAVEDHLCLVRKATEKEKRQFYIE